MSVEERVARALQQEADRVEVDLTALHATTRARLDVGTQRGRRLQPALVAAVVLLLLVGLVAVTRLGDRDSNRSGPATTTRSGTVADRFRCPSQVTADRGRRRVDDALVLNLGHGPAEAARSVQAPRYAYTEHGRTALLRLGNADGSLAATATFRRVAQHWVLDTTVRCSGTGGGIEGQTADALRLGRRQATPYAAQTMVDDPARAVLVDDRSTYDQSGFERHRTVWASPCAQKVCVVGGTPNGFTRASIATGLAPQDLTSVLLDADAMVGRKKTLALWGIYDRRDKVASVIIRLRDGTTRSATRFSGPGWTGRLYLAVGRPDQVSAVVVRRAHGRSTSYAPGAIN